MDARALVVSALLALSLSVGQPGAADQVTVYAHRGGAELKPENTLEAFRYAHDTFSGVWLELDTQLAGDGELVVIHDATLDRTTGCEGQVVDRTAQELAACGVPTMRDVLTEGAADGWRLLVELKNIPGEPNFDPTGEDAAGALLALVDETAFPRADIVVQSFFPTSLDVIERDSDLATALLTTTEYAIGALQNAAYATARGYEITAPNHTAPDLTAETVDAIQALGRRVVLWTVDDPADIARALALGVDGIISDRPDLVYQATGS